MNKWGFTHTYKDKKKKKILNSATKAGDIVRNIEEKTTFNSYKQPRNHASKSEDLQHVTMHVELSTRRQTSFENQYAGNCFNLLLYIITNG